MRSSPRRSMAIATRCAGTRTIPLTRSGEPLRSIGSIFCSSIRRGPAACPSRGRPRPGARPARRSRCVRHSQPAGWRAAARARRPRLARLVVSDLEGAALAHTIYRQPHLRPRSDADLLVRAADAERVARVLEAQGYARAVEVSGAFVTSQMHFDRPGSPDSRYALDIHWRSRQHARVCRPGAVRRAGSGTGRRSRTGCACLDIEPAARARPRVHPPGCPPRRLRRSALAVGCSPACRGVIRERSGVVRVGRSGLGDARRLRAHARGRRASVHRACRRRSRRSGPARSRRSVGTVGGFY